MGTETECLSNPHKSLPVHPFDVRPEGHEFRHGFYLDDDPVRRMTIMPQMKKKRIAGVHGDESGITLIEVLAAMIILALGILTLLPMATLSIEANMQARDTDQVMAMIQNQIEWLRNQDALTSGSYTDTTTGMYMTWWTQTESAGLQEVIVEVNWESELGVPHRQRGTTYMYRED
jgi:type II secretory pathway pseudopilin PulG